MGITNMYPNLPGHLVEFKDGGLQLTSLPDDQSGFKKSLLILGTALDGPINEPVKIDSKTVTQLFGSEVNDKNYPNGATLTKYAKQAFAHGFSDVRCMRVTGTEAKHVIGIPAEGGITQIKHTTSAITVAGHPETTIKIKDDLLPISTVSNAPVSICTSPPVDGVPQNPITVAGGIEYVPSIGEITLPANHVTKNSTVYVMFEQQQIRGKNDAVSNKENPNYITKATYNGTEVEDTVTTPIEIPTGFDYDTGTIKFSVDIPSGSELYYAIFSNGTLQQANCYPEIDETIVTIEGTDRSDAEAMAAVINKTKDLKVIIDAIYDDGGTEKHKVLAKTDFTINGSEITLSKTKVKAGTPETEYPIKKIAVRYLTYKNVYVHDTINLQAQTTTAVTGDVIDLQDEKKAIESSIKVLSEGNTVASGDYTVNKDGANTIVTIHPGALNFKTKVQVEYLTEEKEETDREVTFRSIYGGDVYNDARVKIEKQTDETTGQAYVKVTFYKPESKFYSKTEVPFYYKSSDVPTVGQLRDFLKNYALNNVFAIETDDDDITLDKLYKAVAPAEGSTDPVYFNLAGGSNGLNPTDEELFIALSGKRDENGYLIERGAYQILENYHCDYIYPAGARADKTVIINERPHSFQYELALVCAVLTYRTKMTHGFIDVSPNSNTSLIGVQKHVDKLINMPNLFYMQDQNGEELLDSENKRMDIGWYTSVVVGPDPVMTSDTLGTYYGSAAIAYAALVASLKPQSSPMNKPLPNVKGMKYKFSNKQMDALIGNRMVCFRLKNEGTATASSIPYCVDAMTSGSPNCDYARMTTVNIVTDVVDQIREVADPFIGEPNTIEQRNALSALIAKRLSRIYEQGEVTYYSFEINATVQQVLLGECTISLTLVCPMELRKITTVVSLRAAA